LKTAKAAFGQKVSEIGMKNKMLAIPMAALSIGVSPFGFMSASAQDAPILPKRGAAHSGDLEEGVL
jgi:Spy/CpxP family protein refolding chaperone